MKRLKAPIPYFGGKHNMAGKLVPLFPDHRTYVEVFGGAGGLLFAKESSPVEIYNDRDSDLVNFMRVLRDRDGLFPDFYNRACLSPYSREEWLFCRNHINDDPDPVERARRFFIVARFSFSGVVGASFATNVTATNGGKIQRASAYQGVMGILPQLSERLVSVLIENRDFRDIIRVYDTEDTFFYLDPPYLPETRRRDSYRYEMTTNDHRELVDMLRNVKGKVLLSGYASELYDSLAWNRQQWDVCCKAAYRIAPPSLHGANAATNPRKRTEVVWMNY